jgi:Flp pilus assembly pilin Flp
MEILVISSAVFITDARGERARQTVGTSAKESDLMNDSFVRICLKLQNFKEENAQDMIEYVLLAAIVALGAVAGIAPLATQVNATFTAITTTVTSYS